MFQDFHDNMPVRHLVTNVFCFSRKQLDNMRAFLVHTLFNLQFF